MSHPDKPLAQRDAAPPDASCGKGVAAPPDASCGEGDAAPPDAPCGERVAAVPDAPCGERVAAPPEARYGEWGGMRRDLPYREWVAVRRRERAAARPVSFAVLLAGIGLLVIGLNGHAPPRWSPPPVPPGSAAEATTTDGPVRDGVLPHGAIRAGAAARDRHAAGAAAGSIGRSAPVSVQIPAIGVNARVISLGVAAGGEIGVPPLSEPMVASWYNLGPAPGQAGTAVLLGHVDAASVGPAVFYSLGALRPGDLVYVRRRDARTAVFRVTAVRMYPEDAFPAARIYAGGGRPELRLIPCGGQFDGQTHMSLDRVVVFAGYIGAR